MELFGWENFLPMVFRTGPFAVLTNAIALLAVAVGVLLAITWVLFWFFRLCSSTVYFENSHAFAKNSDLLQPRVPSLRKDHADEHECAADGGNKMVLSDPILSSMDVFKLDGSLSASQQTLKSVFLTGASGFVGSMVLYDLLRNREALCIDRVIVLCRKKRTVSAHERIMKLLDGDMFSFMSAAEKVSVVEVAEGDVTMENAGMSQEDIDTLCNRRIISHVIHCAASVSFSQTLGEAARANISSTLSLQKLAYKFNRNQADATTLFCHVSTAFVHGGKYGTDAEPLPPTLFSFGRFDPQDIYDSMLGEQAYASEAYKELGFPNTYTFSKCVCEHLLRRNSGSMSTLIVRPSIVGPSIEAPYEGWAGNLPTTIVAASCLYFSFQWNLWAYGVHRAPVVPVDVLSRYILAKCFNAADVTETVGNDALSNLSSSERESSRLDSGTGTVRVYNATWDASSPSSACSDWVKYGYVCVHVGAVMGHCNRQICTINVFLLHFLKLFTLSFEHFKIVHRLFFLYPVHALVKVVELLGKDTFLLKKLQKYQDFPILFYPFTTKAFHFRSDLIAPLSHDGERYCLSCAAAAHNFIMLFKNNGNLQKIAKDPSTVTRFQVAGPWANRDRSLLWAQCQPQGSLVVRIACYFLAKLLYSVFSEVTVDITSFTLALKTIKNKGYKRIVLAPTYRSFFDYLLLLYVSFCLPEMQIDIPFILAKSNLARVPFLSWLTRQFSIMFTSLHPKELDDIDRYSSRDEIYLQVIVEGTMSRDRRFVEPATDVLRCLHQSGGDLLIVPIAISYERLPEQNCLRSDVDGNLAEEIPANRATSWLYDVCCRKMQLGRVHISACSALEIGEKQQPNFDEIVDEIQIRQQEKIVVSDYHIKCSAKLLNLDTEVVRRAFSLLNVSAWPNGGCEFELPEIPESKSELLSCLLQASPHFSPLFDESHPAWARWLNRISLHNKIPPACDPSVKAMVEALSKLFHETDLCIDLSHSELVAKGLHCPSQLSRLQIARQVSKGIPDLLLMASLMMKFPEMNSKDD